MTFETVSTLVAVAAGVAGGVASAVGTGKAIREHGWQNIVNGAAVLCVIATCLAVWIFLVGPAIFRDDSVPQQPAAPLSLSSGPSQDPARPPPPTVRPARRGPERIRNALGMDLC